MKDRPHGAKVVPSVAVTIAMASPVIGMLGTTVPRRAAPQSGPAMKPDTI